MQGHEKASGKRQGQILIDDSGLQLERKDDERTSQPPHAEGSAGVKYVAERQVKGIVKDFPKDLSRFAAVSLKMLS